MTMVWVQASSSYNPPRDVNISSFFYTFSFSVDCGNRSTIHCSIKTIVASDSFQITVIKRFDNICGGFGAGLFLGF